MSGRVMTKRELGVALCLGMTARPSARGPQVRCTTICATVHRDGDRLRQRRHAAADGGRIHVARLDVR